MAMEMQYLATEKDTPEGMALKTIAYSSADTGILYFCKKSESLLIGVTSLTDAAAFDP